MGGLTCSYTLKQHNSNIVSGITQLSLCFFHAAKQKELVNNHSQSSTIRLVLFSGIVPAGLRRDSSIVMGVRAQQKEKTRRSLVEAAFSQLSAERSFASLSLREVAREAGIAPTSFYRHFRDVDELGLTMVDESGLMLRQLMRQARQRIAKGGSVIRTSVSTFMEFIGNNPNAFRLLLRERSGTSAAFRAAVAREIQHFIAELADYLELENHMPRAFTEAQAEAMVTIVFSAGAEALDIGVEQRRQLEERLVLQLRMISKGAYYWYRREQEKMAHQTDE